LNKNSAQNKNDNSDNGFSQAVVPSKTNQQTPHKNLEKPNQTKPKNIRPNSRVFLICEAS
jgi:hypothetical protein